MAKTNLIIKTKGTDTDKRRFDEAVKYFYAVQTQECDAGLGCLLLQKLYNDYRVPSIIHKVMVEFLKGNISPIPAANVIDNHYHVGHTIQVRAHHDRRR